MSASLVGSEMCIRDSVGPTRWSRLPEAATPSCTSSTIETDPRPARQGRGCLLYTSDAADDM
eukprot:2778801-Alexandrium_andersonii.AAC.1